MAKKKTSAHDLGRRERQIMDAIFHLESASVAEVLAILPDPPSYSAVRTMIGVLESKGLLTHRREGTKYIYLPTQSRIVAGRSAVRHLIKTFFGDCATDAVAAILDLSSDKLSDEDLARLAELIDRARQEGK